jgi:hypothetical protein
MPNKRFRQQLILTLLCVRYAKHLLPSDHPYPEWTDTDGGLLPASEVDAIFMAFDKSGTRLSSFMDYTREGDEYQSKVEAIRKELEAKLAQAAASVKTPSVSTKKTKDASASVETQPVTTKKTKDASASVKTQPLATKKTKDVSTSVETQPLATKKTKDASASVETQPFASNRRKTAVLVAVQPVTSNQKETASVETGRLEKKRKEERQAKDERLAKKQRNAAAAQVEAERLANTQRKEAAAQVEAQPLATRRKMKTVAPITTVPLATKQRMEAAPVETVPRIVEVVAVEAEEAEERTDLINSGHRGALEEEADQIEAEGQYVVVVASKVVSPKQQSLLGKGPRDRIVTTESSSLFPRSSRQK